MLWVTSVVIAMFLSAWATATFVTKDMLSTGLGKSHPEQDHSPQATTPTVPGVNEGDASNSTPPAVGLRGSADENLRALKAIWASRIPPGEDKITWLI